MSFGNGNRPVDACQDVDFTSLPELDMTRLPAAGWEPPGPTCFDFVQSTDFIRLFAGGYGSGKSSTLSVDALFRAAMQPRQKDGVRRFRRLYISNTYRDLYKTLVRTLHEWIPKDFGVWQGGQDRPARQDIKLRDEFGRIDLTAEFVAIGEHKAEDVMDGYESTDIVIDRASTISRDVYETAIGRVPRYPQQVGFHPGDAAIAGVSLAFNKPDTDHWLYDLAVANPPPDARFFDQPGQRSPQAENLQNVAPGYYDRMIRNWPEWRIRRFVDNEWGFDRSGTPVYAEYRDTVHAARAPLAPIEGLPIGIGLDGGSTLSPAAVFVQLTQEGQWRVLSEVVPGHGWGATRFAQLLREHIAERYAGARLFAFADPAAFAGGDREGGEVSWADAISQALGIAVEPAPTNELSMRLDAVTQALMRDVPGGAKGMLVDPVSCPVLRKGFNSGYQFRKTKIAGKEETETLPAKTGEAGRYSHPHDALQYVVLGREGLHAVKARAGHNVWASPGSDLLMPAQTDWNPLNT